MIPSFVLPSNSYELCTISLLVLGQHDQFINILSQVNEYLEKGGLSMQLGSVNKFGRIQMDQAIKETANKEIKAPGERKDSVHEPVLSRDTISLLNI